MAEEIVNRVANSKLKVIDLEQVYPEGKRIVFDLKDWLFQELVLREKDFRAHVSGHDWSQYKDAYVTLHCSSDAIVPDWAFMLVSIALEPFAKKVVFGDLETLESLIFSDVIADLNLEAYQDAPVIIKGCSNKPIPLNAMLLLTTKLRPIARSIMFGEACSSVPLYKRAK
ncbi:DUF2480 family protein [Winogradskyella maritima]|uniref:DUF2480 family protein n=1 Tax=Winogradskyella maritima TaxID=1517766 RepID=A0ABV8AFX8_9FLAO|nr:DUF2480 family protein [Winogradskyella maritima]